MRAIARSPARPQFYCRQGKRNRDGWRRLSTESRATELLSEASPQFGLMAEFNGLDSPQRRGQSSILTICSLFRRRNHVRHWVQIRSDLTFFTPLSFCYLIFAIGSALKRLPFENNLTRVPNRRLSRSRVCSSQMTSSSGGWIN